MSFLRYLAWYDALIVTLALQGAQLWTALLFFLRIRRGLSRPAADYAPATALLVPCAGVFAGFDENVRALLAQDYPGELRTYFVTPSVADPAHRRLEGLLKGTDSTRLLASGLAPKGCSGKITDLLFALERIEGEPELLAFADADLRVRPDWLKNLAAPLADPAIGVSTSASIYVPRGLAPAGLLRMAWIMNVIPFLVFFDCVSGQSMAMRRKDFASAGVAEEWKVSLLEDLALGALARKQGLRVRFAAGAVSAATEPLGFGAAVAVFDRWLRCVRLFDLRVWTLGAVLAALKLGIVLWALLRPAWDILVLFWLLEALALGAVAFAFRCHYPALWSAAPALVRAGAPLLAALAAPLLLAVQSWNFLRSALSNTVDWGPYRYHVHGKGNIEVLRR